MSPLISPLAISYSLVAWKHLCQVDLAVQHSLPNTALRQAARSSSSRSCYCSGFLSCPVSCCLHSLTRSHIRTMLYLSLAYLVCILPAMAVSWNIFKPVSVLFMHLGVKLSFLLVFDTSACEVKLVHCC